MPLEDALYVQVQILLTLDVKMTQISPVQTEHRPESVGGVKRFSNGVVPHVLP